MHQEMLSDSWDFMTTLQAEHLQEKTERLQQGEAETQALKEAAAVAAGEQEALQAVIAAKKAEIEELQAQVQMCFQACIVQFKEVACTL